MSKSRGLLVALLVSAALNLLIAGAVIGRWSRGSGPPPPFDWTASALAPETRQEVRRSLQARAESVRPLRAEMRQVAQAVRRAAVADPFDAQAMKEAMAAMRQAQQRYQALMHDSVVDVAAELPREQRLALMRQALERDSGRERRKPGRGEPPRQ